MSHRIMPEKPVTYAQTHQKTCNEEIVTLTDHTAYLHVIASCPQSAFNRQRGPLN